MDAPKRQKGFIGTIVLIIMALAVAKYVFNFDVVQYLTSPKAVSVYNYLINLAQIIWSQYIVVPYLYVLRAVQVYFGLQVQP